MQYPLLALIGLTLAVGSAEATQQLAPTIVTASRIGETLADTPPAVTVIGRAEILASGATNIAEVLRGRGGAQLTDLYGDGSRSVASLRGFGANAGANTLILLDGRRLNNIDLAEPDLNSISLKDVERIEILQGSAGTLFGDQAVGGVINIITRRSTEFSADIGGSLASFDGRSLRGAVQDRVDNGLNYRFGAETRHSDNYRDNNAHDYENLFGRLGFEGAAGALFVEHQRIDERAWLPGALFADQLVADRRQTRLPDDFFNTDTRVFRLGGQHALGANWLLEAELTRRASEGNGKLYSTPLSQDRTERGLTPRLSGSLASGLGDIQVTLGSDLERSDYALASPYGATTDRRDRYAVYARSVLPLAPAWRLTIGGRYSRIEDELKDSSAFPAGIHLDEQASVFELGLGWRPMPGWRLFLRRDGNFRFPKVDEMAYASPGVRGLQTQTGASYETGAEWQSDQGHAAKIVAYRLELENELDFDPTATDPFGFSTGANVNLDPTRRLGLILEGRLALDDNTGLSAAYGYVDARFRHGPWRGNDIPFVAEHSLRLSADHRFAAGFHVLVEMQTIGQRVASGDYSNSLEPLPGYTVFNLNSRYEYNDWTATLRVNNLTDKRYSDYAAAGSNDSFDAETGFYPAPERNLRFEVDYRFR